MALIPALGSGVADVVGGVSVEPSEGSDVALEGSVVVLCPVPVVLAAAIVVGNVSVVGSVDGSAVAVEGSYYG